MKIKSTLALGALAAMMTFTACGPKEFNLSSPVSEITLAETAVTDSVVINGSDGTCQVAYAPAWVEATVTDSVVTIKAQPNTGADNRTDSLVVTCGASKISLPVVQGHKATKLEIPKGTKLSFPKEGGEETVEVDTDGSVTVEAFEGVTANYADGKLAVKATPNTGDSAINGTIKLTAGDFTQEIPVTVNGNICPTCKGTGKIKCSKCKGQGYIFVMTEGAYGCTKCGGHGYGGMQGVGMTSGSGKQPCPKCKGK